MLLLDEVQCGIGRSGDFFAFDSSGVTPDAIGMAKGLGGGFPIGAIWIAQPYEDLFQPGSHGTTFGGNPLASAAANAVLDVIEQESLLEKVKVNSSAWHSALQALCDSHPELVTAFRGKGYMVGLQLKEKLIETVTEARNQGLLIVPAGNNTIRLLPPLTATPEELSKSVEILDVVLEGLK